MWIYTGIDPPSRDAQKKKLKWWDGGGGVWLCGRMGFRKPALIGRLLKEKLRKIMRGMFMAERNKLGFYWDIIEIFDRLVSTHAMKDIRKAPRLDWR